MNEKEFHHFYLRQQDQIHASDSLKRKVLAAQEDPSQSPPSAVPETRSARRVSRIERQESDKPGSSSLGDKESRGKARRGSESNKIGQERNHQQSPAKPKRPRKLWIGIAACLITAALGLGLMPFFQGNDDGSPAMVPAFVVKAYANETGDRLEPGTDGQVFFDRDMTIGFQADDYVNAGYFTGCLLKVEGEDIVRVQASLESGELYRLSYEEFVKSSDPARWNEALNWSPLGRGSGSYYAAYDYITPSETNDGRDRFDPDKTVQVRLMKRLGSNIDIPYDSNSYLGLWTNEPLTSQNWFNEVINVFDGRKLTITVEFEDGHFETQVIELHAADVRAEQGEGIGNASSGLHILPEVVDVSALSEEELQQTFIIHSLYGEIVETNDQAFPNTSDEVNARINIVDEPYRLPSFS